MSGASDAATALRERIMTALRPIGAAVNEARGAQNALVGAVDLLDMMHCTAGVVLACEALQQVAKDAEVAARASLASAMESTGATTLHTGLHTVSLRDAPRTVTITDPKAVPAEFLRHRDPEPDKTAIGKLLRDGKPVPGAALSNGGAALIQIRSNKS